ncbi:hypothetical protein [uncultured Mediterranean phage uvMED]|nr:hypothetical protein [uncultured Mediterranean phage uvMED]
MGYTNYWHQHINFTNDQWKQIQSEAQYVKEIGENNIDVHSEDEEIIINGRGQSCETFVLYKNKATVKEYEQQDLAFNFCKTRELPYDIYVWHLLVFCAGMINDTEKFSISRDR